jgi:hypothetical protein
MSFIRTLTISHALGYFEDNLKQIQLVGKEKDKTNNKSTDNNNINKGLDYYQQQSQGYGSVVVFPGADINSGSCGLGASAVKDDSGEICSLLFSVDL